MMTMRVLDDQSIEIQHLCNRDKRFAKLYQLIGPISYTCNDDPFAFLAHEIIEQMLSIKAGRVIYGRLKDLCGGMVTPDTVLSISKEEMLTIGASKNKVETIRLLAKAVRDGEINFEQLPGLSDREVIRQLISIKGIGEWTAHMYLIFVLDRPDVLPTKDGAFLQVYRWMYKTDDLSKKSVIKKCQKWKPYRSTAVRYTYYAINRGLTKQTFHLYKEMKI